MNIPSDFNPWLNGVASYISGKFEGKGIRVEIDTRLSIVDMSADCGDHYYFQGEEADDVIKEICWRATSQYPNESFADNVINYFNERLF